MAEYDSKKGDIVADDQDRMINQREDGFLNKIEQSTGHHLGQHEYSQHAAADHDLKMGRRNISDMANH